MAQKQWAALLILRQKKPGAFTVCDQMLFDISLQNICLFTTQTIFKAAVQNAVVLDPRHQLPPSGKKYRSEWKRLKLKGKVDHYWGPSVRLPPSMLLQEHWCSIQYQTRDRLNSLTPPKSHVLRMLSSQHLFFLSLQIQSYFAKQLANTNICCTGPSWLAGSKTSLCLFSSFWES